jgi:hypothetical protein
LEVRQAVVREAGVHQDQGFELRQSLEVFESGIGDVWHCQVQLLKSRQSFEVYQPSVGHVYVVSEQLQRVKFGQFADLF